MVSSLDLAFLFAAYPLAVFSLLFCPRAVYAYAYASHCTEYSGTFEPLSKGRFTRYLLIFVFQPLLFRIRFDSIPTQSLRLATIAARRSTASLLGATQRRTAILVPRMGTPEEMQAQAIEQIRARVQIQTKIVQGQVHHSVEEEMAESRRWANITFMVALPICVLSAAYSYFFDGHVHRFEGELPEFMKVRTKEFPWECSDCDLFDGKCWEKCRANKEKEA
jgi:hypothetical protein